MSEPNPYQAPRVPVLDAVAPLRRRLSGADQRWLLVLCLGVGLLLALAYSFVLIFFALLLLGTESLSEARWRRTRVEAD